MYQANPIKPRLLPFGALDGPILSESISFFSQILATLDETVNTMTLNLIVSDRITVMTLGANICQDGLKTETELINVLIPNSF